MSGHSKWSTIKRKKGANDAQRAKIFTKVSREILVAVKSGGPDPDNNSALKDAISKARSVNMPNDNIARTIKKAAGGTDGDNYETVVYEGYGPSGVAVIVDTLTDNRNRTAANIRHYFDKFGGNLGTNGCVSFMFDKKGVIVIEADGVDEDEVTMDALEAGAEDLSLSDGVFEITTAPEDFHAVRDALDGKYELASAELSMVPQTMTQITDADHITLMGRLLDNLDDDDDVQNVYHNWDMPNDIE
ncbi:MAG: YebC/PmpR family DNA-binding transcriptional regulator [Clostridia bacterium]|nr:YebC/PmpR family DNA-binding transcriptional regulator [Clostridia bacterium]MBQ7751815.1 YebC/PmpR family DNA-binding transcriptional regulator [Clostridia bacterium]